MTSTENVTAIITIEDVCNHHLYGAIKCMNMMITNDVPADQADVGFIMGVMTKIATHQRIGKDEEKDKDNVLFKLRLDENSAVCLWHCLNVSLQNEFVPEQGQQVFVSQLLTKLAIKIDQVIAMRTAPAGITSDTIPKLELVED